MVGELRLPWRDRVKGRAMRRNLTVHARLLFLAVGAVEACRFLHLPVWSWVDPALFVWSRLITVGAGVLVLWNVFAVGKALGDAWDRRQDERLAGRAKTLLAAYPAPAALQPLAQPGNTMQEHSVRMGMLQAAVVQGMVSMSQARPGTGALRYIPLTTGLPTMTGPQAKVLLGACAKCGQALSAHLYYGRGQCRYHPPAVLPQPPLPGPRTVHVRACKACGDLMMLEDHEKNVVYCGPCGPQGI